MPVTNISIKNIKMNSSHQISVIVAYLEELGDRNKYEFLASVNNLTLLRETLAIGEGVASTEFEMIFPNTIGQSNWKLLFYPRGQYADGHAGSGVGIYLVMLSCEQPDKLLTANVEFQLQSQNDQDNVGHGPVKNVNAEFKFLVPSKRWVGEPNFFAKNWLNVKRSIRFCKDDTLIIRCSVEEKKELLPNVNETHENSSPMGCISLGDFQSNNNIDWCMDTYDKVKLKKQEPEGNQDDVDNNHTGWCTVISTKGKQKQQSKNWSNVDKSNASQKRKHNQPKQKNKSNYRGGKKKE